ncbi:MAG: bis(5'-nucleosyl)-tetraphosphatase [Candidatus Micrarchaeia archaeon]
MDEERSAGAVVFYEEGGKRLYLILRYGEGHWDFPKGHIEDSEDPANAMLREVREETGLSVEPVPGFEYEIEYTFRARYDQNRPKHKKVIFFIARSKSRVVKLSHEHSSYVWLELDKALARVTYENSRGVLRRADAYLRSRGLK